MVIAERGMSVKYACRALGIDRKTFYYQPILKEADEMIKNKLMELANQYPRYGFKKFFWLLRQQGHLWNRKRVYRLYRACGLNLKKKPKKRLAA